MGDLVVDGNQLTFPWRDRARKCPSCQGRRVLVWNDYRHPCRTCRGVGELRVGPEIHDKIKP